MIAQGINQNKVDIIHEYPAPILDAIHPERKKKKGRHDYLGENMESIRRPISLNNLAKEQYLREKAEEKRQYELAKKEAAQKEKSFIAAKTV